VNERLEPLAIFGGIVTVSLAVAIATWSGLGVSWPYAALAGMVASVALLLAAAHMRRGQALDAQAQAKVAALEAEVSAMRAQLASVDERMAVLDTAMVEYSRKTVSAVASELDLVGSVVRDLAHTVAMHDAELFAKAEPPVAAPEAALSAPTAPHAAPPPSFTFDDDLEPERPAGLSAGDAALLARAILQDRVELQLQPIVSLPSRKVSLYETHLRVRLADGRSFAAPQIMSLLRLPARELAPLGLTEAERNDLAGRLDAFLLATIAKIARHLLGRGRDVPVLCGLSPQAAVDPQVYDTLATIKRAEPELVGRLVFQLGLDDLAALGALDLEGLEDIRALGFRFAANGIDHLGLDSRALFDRGFRFASASAWLLIEAAGGAIATEIHPADLAGLMERNGLGLIVEEIDAESTIAELADFGVALGKGELFGGPRPVRADVLAGQPPEPVPTPAPPPAAAPTSARARVASVASGGIRALAAASAPLATGDRTLNQAAARIGPTPASAPKTAASPSSAPPAAPAPKRPTAATAAGDALASTPARRADGGLASSAATAPPQAAPQKVDDMRQSLRAFLSRSEGS
jgi:cyclic-di-GMP phosphodiesterase, flagellum assembly factor TipF